MNLFTLKDWVLTVSDEAWALLPFKKILKRDKNRNKDIANKEMLFIYYYSDIKSDYQIISNDKEREIEIKKDIGLPDNWKIDLVIQEAVDFYNSRSLTVKSKLYKNALKAANDVSDYLAKTDELLNERDANGKPTTDITKITNAIKSIKGIMVDLKAAEIEVLREQEELQGKRKGSREMGLFEQGLNFEE